MKIFTGFKVCEDLSLLKENEIMIEAETEVDLHFLPHILNCYDESALELSFRVAEAIRADGRDCRISMMTIDGLRAEPFLRTMRALGADETVRIDPGKQDLRFCPMIIAKLLADYIRKSSQELILLGKEAPHGNHGLVSCYLSELLDIPCVPDVVAIEDVTDDNVNVLSHDQTNELRLQVSLPCILEIGNVVVSKLRIPTLRQRAAVKGLETQVYPMENMTDDVTLQPESLKTVVRARKTYRSSYEAEEAVEDIWEKSLSKKWEEI